MPLPPEEAWFPTKRYGWGWDAPRRWQGWVVVAVFVALLAVGVPVIVTRSNPGYAIAYAWLLGGLLISICWWKGEKPRWRWGDE